MPGGVGAKGSECQSFGIINEDREHHVPASNKSIKQGLMLPLLVMASFHHQPHHRKRASPSAVGTTASNPVDQSIDVDCGVRSFSFRFGSVLPPVLEMERARRERRNENTQVGA